MAKTYYAMETLRKICTAKAEKQKEGDKLAEKDWGGNSHSTFSQLGARNYAQNEREQNDYYASDPKAIDLLCAEETFTPIVWECAVGGGVLAEGLKKHGYQVKCSDVVDRGYPGTEIIDFLTYGDYNLYSITKNPSIRLNVDIITNPPYKYAEEFIWKAMNMLCEGRKLALFLKLQFLEGKRRKELYRIYPPKTIYVSSSRLTCAMNGEFEKYKNSTAICYCWYVWQKGFEGDPVIKWIN